MTPNIRKFFEARTAESTYVAILSAAGILFLLDPMLSVLIFLSTTIFLVLLTVEPKNGLFAAALLEICIAIFVPTYAVPGSLLAACLTAGIVAAIFALFRATTTNNQDPNRARQLLFAYFIFMLAGYVLHGKVSSLPTSLLLVTWALLTSIVLYKLSLAHKKMVLSAVSAILIVSVVLASGEMFTNLSPLWGFMGSEQDVSLRENNLVSSLPGRAVSFFGHPILFGLFCAMVAYFTVLKPRSFGTPRSIRVLLFLVAFYGILLSGSRSPLIAMVAGLIVASLYKYSKNQMSRLFSSLLGAGALGAFAWFYVYPLVTSAEGSLSFEHRFGIVTSFIEIMRRGFLDNIVGAGPGTSQELFSTGTFTQTGLSVIDNQFVLTFISGGFVGLFLLMLFLIRAFYSGGYAAKGIVAMTVIMMFSFDTASWGLGLLLTTLCTGLSHVDDEGPLSVNSYEGIKREL